MDEAKEYESSLAELTKSSSDNEAESQVLTFAKLKELIESKNVDQIPNNKIIPIKVNVGQSVQLLR